MNPSELSAVLRRMSSAINESKNPSRALVLKDLQRILAAVKTAAPPSIPRLIEKEDMGANWERLMTPGMPQENVYNDPKQLGLLGDPTITHDTRDPVPGGADEPDMIPMDYVENPNASDPPDKGEYAIYCFEDPKSRTYDACVMLMNVPGTDKLMFHMKKAVAGMVPKFNLSTLKPQSVDSLRNAYKSKLVTENLKEKGYLINSEGDNISELFFSA